MPVPARLEHCEKLVNVLLARKQLTLPPRTRAEIQRLLHWTYPVTLPVAAIRTDALAFSLWETSWRGMSTVHQTSIPALHVQTLTVKWWVCVVERMAHLLPRIGTFASLHGPGVLVGGLAINQFTRLAGQIGADAWSSNAITAVVAADKLVA